MRRLRAGKLGGTAAAAFAALALLVLGCVFVAMAGPRASLDIRTRALSHAVADAPASQKTVNVSTDWNDFTTALAGGGLGAVPNVTAAQLNEVKQQLGSDLAAEGVPLQPRATAWAGLSSFPTNDAAAAPARSRPGRPRWKSSTGTAWAAMRS